MTCEDIRHIAKVFLVIVAGFAAFPTFASAQWWDFLPKPYENGADIDVAASHEADKNKADGHGVNWTDTFLKEKLTIYSTGYMYHPRFMTYLLSLSGALKQEEFEASYAESRGWRSSSAEEYNAILDILPEHPYTLKLFSRRMEPLFKEKLATHTNNVETSSGAIFRYRRRPFFFHARYIENSLESSLSSSDVKLFSADGSCYKEYGNGNLFSLEAAFAHKEFDTSTLTTGESSDYSFTNSIGLKKVRLDSSVSGTSEKQDSPFRGSLNNDQFSWNERLSATLPLNFRADLSYSLRKVDFTAGAYGTYPEIRTRNDDNRIALGISHVLYRSLRTNYAFHRDSLSSPGGDTTSLSHSLSADYTKTIPQGRLLAGLSLGTTVTETTGAATVVYEPHLNIPVPAITPYSFSLGSQTVDRPTIRVFLNSPIPPFDLVPLDEFIHYTVALLGTTYQITIINLPAPFAVPGIYDFRVSYSLIPANFKLRTDTFAGNVGLDLYNGMLHPYYSYSSSKSNVEAGIFPGVSPDTTVNTVGVFFQKDPFRARAEYQNQDSNISPYTQWKGEVNITKEINETTRAYASASYTDTVYPQGTSLPGGQGFSVQAATVSANIQKKFLGKGLLFSASGSYSYFRGLTNGTTYSLDSALQWKIGRLILSLGANASSSDSEAPGTLALDVKRTHQYYYFNVKRKLF